MAKNRKKKYKSNKIDSLNNESISNNTNLLPENRTIEPDEIWDDHTASPFSSDSTSSSDIYEKENNEDQYASSNAELIDKHFLSKFSLPFIIAFIVICYFFVQDNSKGLIDNWEGIMLTLRKSGILLAVLFVILIFQFINKNFIKLFRGIKHYFHK
ncbi:MAG: hypothetical protein ABIA04_03270 [Pseudomonadota bacterium]